MARRGVTPYRYIQLARYLIQRWIDHGPASMAAAMRSSALWKGKGRAQAAGMLGTRVALAGMDQRDSDALLRMSMELEAERRGERGSGRGSPSGGHGSGQDGHKDAGPSRLVSKERSVLEPDPRAPPLPKEMYRLMNDERLFVKGAAKPPRELVVLCHGLYGFSTATPIPLFPSLKLHYWASVLEVLRDRLGAKVLVVGVKGTGSIKERAEQMHAFLKEKLPRGTGVNFVAHSMGGLDCRHLISTIKPTTYTPLSLTTIGTPHRGSPFMDWCAANIGVGAAAAAAAAAATAKAASSSGPAKLLPYSLKAPLLSRPSEEQGKKEESGWTAGLTSYLLNIFDSPAYSNLTTSFLREHFNPATPDSPNVKYTSLAGRCAKMSVMHPLWFTKLVLDAAAENGYANDGRVEGTPYEGNDGLVDVTSAKWGEFLGAVDQTHHWDLRGEGGLFPQPGSIKTGEDSDGGLFGSLQMPGSWDSGGLSEHLGLASSEAKAMAGSAIAKASAAIGSDFGTSSDSADSSKSRENVGASPSPGHRSSDAQKSTSSSSSSSSWDVAQVGQVIDWVTDLFPGDNKAAETSKKQLADAQKEKDKAEWREREIQSFTTGTGGGEERRPNGEKKKNKGSKFDLARFYGGLMLKLRDDGF